MATTFIYDVDLFTLGYWLLYVKGLEVERAVLKYSIVLCFQACVRLENSNLYRSRLCDVKVLALLSAIRFVQLL